VASPSLPHPYFGHSSTTSPALDHAATPQVLPWATSPHVYPQQQRQQQRQQRQQQQQQLDAAALTRHEAELRLRLQGDDGLRRQLMERLLLLQRCRGREQHLQSLAQQQAAHALQERLLLAGLQAADQLQLRQQQLLQQQALEMKLERELRQQRLPLPLQHQHLQQEHPSSCCELLDSTCAASAVEPYPAAMCNYVPPPADASPLMQGCGSAPLGLASGRGSLFVPVRSSPGSDAVQEGDLVAKRPLLACSHAQPIAMLSPGDSDMDLFMNSWM
jgi:hypothetical protein